MQFEPMNFILNLRYMGVGLASIFIVIRLIIAVHDCFRAISLRRRQNNPPARHFSERRPHPMRLHHSADVHRTLRNGLFCALVLVSHLRRSVFDMANLEGRSTSIPCSSSAYWSRLLTASRLGRRTSCWAC